MRDSLFTTDAVLTATTWPPPPVTIRQGPTPEDRRQRIRGKIGRLARAYTQSAQAGYAGLDPDGVVEFFQQLRTLTLLAGGSVGDRRLAERVLREMRRSLADEIRDGRRSVTIAADEWRRWADLPTSRARNAATRIPPARPEPVAADLDAV